MEKERERKETNEGQRSLQQIRKRRKRNNILFHLLYACLYVCGQERGTRIPLGARRRKKDRETKEFCWDVCVCVCGQEREMCVCVCGQERETSVPLGAKRRKPWTRSPCCRTCNESNRSSLLKRCSNVSQPHCVLSCSKFVFQVYISSCATFIFPRVPNVCYVVFQVYRMSCSKLGVFQVWCVSRALCQVSKSWCVMSVQVCMSIDSEDYRTTSTPRPLLPLAAPLLAS